MNNTDVVLFGLDYSSRGKTWEITMNSKMICTTCDHAWMNVLDSKLINKWLMTGVQKPISPHVTGRIHQLVHYMLRKRVHMRVERHFFRYSVED